MIQIFYFILFFSNNISLFSNQKKKVLQEKNLFTTLNIYQSSTHSQINGSESLIAHSILQLKLTFNLLSFKTHCNKKFLNFIVRIKHLTPNDINSVLYFGRYIDSKGIDLVTLLNLTDVYIDLVSTECNRELDNASSPNHTFSGGTQVVVCFRGSIGGERVARHIKQTQ